VENSDKKRRETWEKIPAGVDVLMTHSPPYGIMDITNTKEHLGCNHLKKASLERQPSFHIFGHAHDNYGKTRLDDIFFINATSFNSHSRLINPPITLVLP
jgi:Icc-related predicted phosphoesterase